MSYWVAGVLSIDGIGGVGGTQVGGPHCADECGSVALRRAFQGVGCYGIGELGAGHIGLELGDVSDDGVFACALQFGVVFVGIGGGSGARAGGLVGGAGGDGGGGVDV